MAERSGTALAVDAVDLTKRYGRNRAVQGISLQIAPGEVVGLLGPNGAGKTTTTKMLLGLVRATSGTARVFGVDARDPAARRRLGYLPEHFRFHDWLTGAELLHYHGRLAGMSSSARSAAVPALLERVGLRGKGDQRIRTYSKGMTQRLGIAQALVHAPGLVLLDEPTSALDPLGRREVRDLIRDLRSDGVAVLLNSHLLSEVELVCDRVVIVDAGRVVRSGNLDELVSTGTEIRVRLDRIDERAEHLCAGFGRVLLTDGTTVVLAADSPHSAPALAGTLVSAGYGLEALIPIQRTLEDVFVELVTGTAG